MNRTFDGLTLDEIIEIQKNINNQCKYYRRHDYGTYYQISEEEIRTDYFDRALIDFTNNSFVTTYIGEQYEDLKFEDYRKTWSDKKEDLEPEIGRNVN